MQNSEREIVLEDSDDTEVHAQMEPREVLLSQESHDATATGQEDATVKMEQDSTANPENLDDSDLVEENKQDADAKEQIEEEDDDVPSDFFDDFSNQDFMAGLDVVDVWDDEHNIKLRLKTETSEAQKKSEDGKPQHARRSRSPYRSRREQKYRSSKERLRYSADRSRRSRDRHRYSRDRIRRSRNRSQHSKDKSRRSKENCKPVAEDTKITEDDSKEIMEKRNNDKKSDERKGNNVVTDRRDPEKTKRDIQKDKDKCAKDKEAKLISEKLKVVETGLVPPGTEMEIDLKEINAVIKSTERKPPIKESLPKRVEEKPVAEQRYARSRSSSYKRTTYRKPYGARHNRESSSEYRRHQLRSNRSSDRSKNRRSISPARARLNPEVAYREERVRRRCRDSSPIVLKRSQKRSNSRRSASNVSERERWLRQRSNTTRHSSNNENDNGRSRNFLDELADKLHSDNTKKRKYKEIQETINRTSRNYSLPMGVGPVPHPGHLVPHPMPVPHPGPVLNYMPGQCFSSSMLTPEIQYDQQYFIGDGYPNQNVFPNQYENPFSGATVPQDSDVTNSNLEHNIFNNAQIRKNINESEQPTEEAYAKLYEEKKITLSDYLTMTAKFTDPSKPVNVHKKVKVISVCQDAIKTLGEDAHLTGRFFVRKLLKETEKIQDAKFQSPLRKVPIVRFHFTTPAKANDEKITSQQIALGKLVASLGLQENPLEPAITPPPSTVPQPPKLNNFYKLTTPNTFSKMCQTDPAICNICEIRNARQFVDKSIQCTTNVVNSETQTAEEDLPAPKSSMKNQSLAHLTPAQLLAQLGSGDMSKRESFSSAEGSPEKKPLLSMRDSFQKQMPKGPEFQDRFGQATASSKFPSLFDTPMMRSNSFESNRPNFDRRQSAPNFNQANPNFGQSKSNFNQNNTSFNQNHPNFNQNHSNFNQNHPNFNHNNPNFNHNNPSFNQNSPNFNQGNPNLGQRNPIFGQGNPNFAQGSSNFGPSNLNLGPRTPGFQNMSNNMDMYNQRQYSQSDTWNNKSPNKSRGGCGLYK